MVNEATAGCCVTTTAAFDNSTRFVVSVLLWGAASSSGWYVAGTSFDVAGTRQCGCRR